MTDKRQFVGRPDLLTNRLFKKLWALHGFDGEDDVVAVLAKGGYSGVSRHAVNAWKRNPEHKNWQRMPERALEALLDGLIAEAREAPDQT